MIHFNTMLNPDLRHLLGEERVLKHAEIHRFIFALPGFIFLCGVYLWLTASNGFTIWGLIENMLRFISNKASLPPINLEILPEQISYFLERFRFKPKLWLSWIVMLYGIFRLYKAAVSFITTRMLLTHSRVIVQTGFWRLRTVELHLAQLDAFDVNQNLPGRFLNFGTIILYSTGGARVQIPCVIAPFELRAYQAQLRSHDDTTYLQGPLV